MEMDSQNLKKRLKETFGSDTQKKIAEKLHTEQGNISKILNEKHKLTLDRAFQIAEEYGVSIDWLVGRSEEKRIINKTGHTTYTTAIRTLCDLIMLGAIDIVEERSKLVLTVEDPLINALVKKSRALSTLDKETIQNWEESKLSFFYDKPVLFRLTWTEMNEDFLTEEAVRNLDWKKVYEAAAEVEKEIAKKMTPVSLELDEEMDDEKKYLTYLYQEIPDAAENAKDRDEEKRPES